MDEIKKMKKILYLVVGLIMIGSVFGLSDPINQTFSEYNNLTRSDSVLDVTQEINVYLGGMFGIGFLLILGFMMFGVSQFFTNSISTQFLFVTFMLSITAVLLRIVGLLADLPFYIILSMTIIGVSIKAFTTR